MKLPVIGIPCTARPGSEAQTGQLQLSKAYADAVLMARGIPLLLPPTDDPLLRQSALSHCDGLLLPGGGDPDPRFYSEPPHPLLGEVDFAQDRFEMALFALAQIRGLPVLGICRGMQLVNVALGGSLYQDISLAGAAPLLHRQNAPRSATIHKVEISPDSELYRLLGSSAVYTNSMHHQAVRRAGEGLRVVARAPDGIAEAMENADGSLLLVQWHPEALLQAIPPMQRIFTELTRRAAITAQKREAPPL